MQNEKYPTGAFPEEPAWAQDADGDAEDGYWCGDPV